jgi:uncharacterized protein (TIGR03382 family)
MNIRWKLFWFAGAIAWGARTLAAPMTEAPILEYSQDGTNFLPFDAIARTRKVSRYYEYHAKSGHPEFGTAHNTSTSAMYWDDRRKALSLILISGAPARRGRTGDSGKVKYLVGGLPSTTYRELSDDPKEYKYDKGRSKTSASFVYRQATDGLILAGLEKVDEFTIRLDLRQHNGVRTWRLVDDADDNGISEFINGISEFIKLNMRKPLYIRASTLGDDSTPPPPPPVPPADGNSGGGTTNPLPEPGLAMWGLAGAFALLTRRRRG